MRRLLYLVFELLGLCLAPGTGVLCAIYESDIRLGIGIDPALWNYEQYFNAGTEAYLDNHWNLCVQNFEKALINYREMRNGIAKCRLGCQTDQLPPLKANQTITVVFFEMTVQSALCLMQCENRVYGAKPRVANHELEAELISRLPYDYLQLCYFKLGKHQEAASSAYTFLVHNPDHKVMQSNFLYYLDLPNVSLKDVRYMEAQKYQELYFSASKAYESGTFEEVVEKMESALKEYFEAEQQCRSLCEGSLPVSPQASFIVSVAHHYTFSLRCKNKCPQQLALGHGDVQHDLLPMFFHYLQYAYFKTGKLQMACESVASYRTLRPNDTVMHDNEMFYRSLDRVKESWFQPRKEVIRYIERYQHDRDFLHFIDESFTFSLTSIPTNRNSEPNSVLPLASEKVSQLTAEIQAKNRRKWEALVQKHGIFLSRAEADLNGTERFQAEFLTSEEECRKLVHLVKEGATSGDGYNGKKSPHTVYEDFVGLSVANAVKLVQKNEIDAAEGQLFLDVSERARLYVKGYFNLTAPLYFAYTHLVCRAPWPESPTEGRTDLSHPIHGDNCMADKDGGCRRERPAYTWRDYSAILYLNNDFEGGEFVFAKTVDNIEAVVSPKCGRMVGFSAGKLNLHGVRAVVSGRRCALAMWFTLDARYQERERIIADQAMKEAQKLKNRAYFSQSSKAWSIYNITNESCPI